MIARLLVFAAALLAAAGCSDSSRDVSGADVAADQETIIESGFADRAGYALSVEQALAVGDVRRVQFDFEGATVGAIAWTFFDGDTYGRIEAWPAAADVNPVRYSDRQGFQTGTWTFTLNDTPVTIIHYLLDGEPVEVRSAVIAGRSGDVDFRVLVSALDQTAADNEAGRIYTAIAAG